MVRYECRTSAHSALTLMSEAVENVLLPRLRLLFGSESVEMEQGNLMIMSGRTDAHLDYGFTEPCVRRLRDARMRTG